MNSFWRPDPQRFIRRSQPPPPPPPPPLPKLSANSTPSVPDSFWYASDFLLGSGMAIIQPSTGKVLLVYENKLGYWFLPKGRKDVGESLEQAALREAYEESGYRVDFLPVVTPSRAPRPPNTPQEAYGRPNTEPFIINISYWKPRINRKQQFIDYGREYLTHWYVGQIPEDAVYEQDTGMPDEKNYTSHLLPIDEALAKLEGSMEVHILRAAWRLWQDTIKYEAEESRAYQLDGRALTGSA